ncbi:tetratricopeptide repeat protein [Kroppenstedtia eburnea]|uniref:tetratricopeptide repeat protein n=1 Tax=Kroppenstedtia eburnea TaxID=714067 RepID=UPI00363E6012
MAAVQMTFGKVDWQGNVFDQLQAVQKASVMLIGEESLGGASLLAQAAEEATEAGHLAVPIDLTGRMSHSFYGLKEMLMALEPVLRREAPDLLKAHGTEWTSLFPESREEEGFQGDISLEEIALAASERRLSRENEQVFRLITGSVSLMVQALERCPSLTGKTLWLFLNRLDEADRLSGHTFHHLLLRHHAQIRVVATIQKIPRPVPSGGDRLERLFDVRRIHSQFLSDLLSDVQTWLMELPVWTEDQVQGFVRAESPDLLECSRSIFLQSGGKPMLARALLSKCKEAKGESFDWTEEEREFLRQYRATHAKEHVWNAAGIQSMDRGRLLLAEQMISTEADDSKGKETHLMLFRNLVERGCPAHWTEEEYHSHLAYHAFFAGLPADGFQFLQQAVSISEHWGNYENVLALVKLALHTEEVFDVGQRIYLWKRCGLMQAFLGNYDEVNTAYEQALRIADHPTMRAQMYAYLTLVATKRQFNVERAESLVDQGLREIEGLEDEMTIIERGWLYNTFALTRFFQKRYKEAYELCKTAFQFLKSQNNSEALHLKINLVSNMSVVAEEMGNLDMALKIWRNFRHFLQGNGNRLFAKIYYYREAGLLLRKGDADTALELFVQAYKEGSAIRDHFHLDFIARDISSLYAEKGLLDECISWLHKSEQHALEVGSHNRAAGARLVAEAVVYEAGDHDKYRLQALKQLKDTCRSEKLREMCHQLILEWERGGHEATQRIIRNELKRPRTKLGMPFYLIHIPYGHVIGD